MISKMQFRTRNLSLIVGALLSLAMASAVSAATDAPAAPVVSTATPAAQPLEELKEVFVHGKKLANEISQTEDDLYFLYNRLNRNHDYDIVCGNMTLDRGSLITKRVCVPGFVADEVAVATTRLGTTGVSMPSYPGFSSGCGGQSIAAGTDANGSAFYQADCVAVGGTGYSISTGSYSPNFGYSTVTSSYDPAFAQARVMQLATPDRRKAYADNVMNVIHSDLRLTRIATHLVGLYQEMDTVHLNYVQMKAEKNAARAADPAKPNLGPRAAL